MTDNSSFLFIRLVGLQTCCSIVYLSGYAAHPFSLYAVGEYMIANQGRWRHFRQNKKLNPKKPTTMQNHFSRNNFFLELDVGKKNGNLKKDLNHWVDITDHFCIVFFSSGLWTSTPVAAMCIWVAMLILFVLKCWGNVWKPVRAEASNGILGWQK